MNRRILHICEDEKFINSAIIQFEAILPGCNQVYVIVEDTNVSFKHVKEQPFVKSISASSILDILKEVKLNDVLIFHSLSGVFYPLILGLPKKVKTVWFCFGYEVYNDNNYFNENRLLDIKTLQQYPDTIESNQNADQKIKLKKKYFFGIIRKSKYYTEQEIKQKVFERMDYLGSSFVEEYEQVNTLIKANKSFFSFWYYPLEVIVNVKLPIVLNKKSILIGNSGYKSGNHLDVFNKLESYKIDADRIVLPLNYGDKSYIEDVIKEGERAFNDKLQPLTTFLSLKDYNAILENVGVAIFNNRRQQAVGNTIALLWFGAKVFLSKQNPFYGYLKRIGILIYCYEMELNEDSCNTFLSLKDIEHNRCILQQELNKEKLLEELAIQINKVN